MATYLPLPRTSGIYQIVNKVTEKRYIGYASNIATRINGHRHELVHKKHPNEYLQNAWSKYGPYNFSFEVVEFCKVNELCLREDYWVRTLMTTDRYYGYNIRVTDPNGTPGHSKETIEKLKNAGTGRSRYGKDNNFYGRKISEENKKKMRESRAHINYKELHRKARGKKVINIKTGIIYGSVAEVSDLTNIPKWDLSRKLLGKRNNNTDYRYLDKI